MSGSINPGFMSVLQQMVGNVPPQPPVVPNDDADISAGFNGAATPMAPYISGSQQIPLSGSGITPPAPQLTPPINPNQKTFNTGVSENSTDAGNPSILVSPPRIPAGVSAFVAGGKWVAPNANLPAVIDSEGPTVSFTPNQNYVDKNLAPEKYPLAALDALAQGQAAAMKSGVLTPGLAKYFLPNQLVENRPIDFAVNDNATSIFNGKDIYAPLAAKLGLAAASPQRNLNRVVYSSPHSEALGSSDDGLQTTYLPGQAKYAAMILAAKPGSTPEAQIKAWNGSGPMADSHLAKVQQMTQALSTMPQNRALMQQYQALLKKYSGAGQ